jgi:hypothetical protein
MAIETRNRIGDIEIVGAAGFTNNPAAATPVDTTVMLGATWIASAPVFSAPAGFTDLSATSEDNQVARFGFVSRNASTTSSTSTMEARARIEYELEPSIGRTNAAWGMVYADSSSTPTFFPQTRWYSGASVNCARGALECRAASGSIEVAWAAQLANDPTAPDTATAVGAYSASSGVQFPAGWTTVAGETRLLVRFGFIAKLPSGSTRQFASVTGTLEFGRL